MNGLEFMGQKWDRLGGDTFQDPSVVGGFQDGSGGNPYSRARVRYGGTKNAEKKDWQAGGGFSKPGIGERRTEWPSYSATSRYGTANPTCAVCGGRLRGAKKCTCEQPHDHWKAIGKRRDPENEGLPDTMTGGGMARHMSAIEEWHGGWLAEVYRVLAPGGLMMAFGGTRVFHRLASAMEGVGFENISMEAWEYNSGFPKSHNVAVYLDRMLSEGKSREVLRHRSLGDMNGKFGESFEGFVSQSKAYKVKTQDGLKWVGWGTALKPAWEPVIVGRKPVAVESATSEEPL